MVDHDRLVPDCGSTERLLEAHSKKLGFLLNADPECIGQLFNEKNINRVVEALGDDDGEDI